MKIELFEENDDGKKVYENDESMFEQAMEIFHPYDEDFIQLLNIYFRLRLAQENHVECLKICQLILTNYHQNNLHLLLYSNIQKDISGKTPKRCSVGVREGFIKWQNVHMYNLQVRLQIWGMGNLV